MTVNDIIEAIALQLKMLYHDKKVYVDEIPQGVNGNFYVHCTDQAHIRHLNRRRWRNYSFEVLYFMADKDSMAFNDWAEVMYWAFERLQVDERILTPIDAKAEDGRDMVYHFTFDIDLTGLIKEDSEPMAKYKLKNNIID